MTTIHCHPQFNGYIIYSLSLSLLDSIYPSLVYHVIIVSCFDAICDGLFMCAFSDRIACAYMHTNTNTHFNRLYGGGGEFRTRQNYNTHTHSHIAAKQSLRFRLHVLFGQPYQPDRRTDKDLLRPATIVHNQHNQTTDHRTRITEQSPPDSNDCGM